MNIHRPVLWRHLNSPALSTWVLSNANRLLNSLYSSLRFETDVIKNIQFVRNIIIFEDYACFLLVSPLAFSSGYENLWDLPHVEAVDWSDMGLSIPGLSAILRRFPAREKRMAISHCSYICMIEQSGSKDPYAAFGGNMAALQRNQVLW